MSLLPGVQGTVGTKIEATTEAGDNTLVEGVAGKKIVVYGAVISVNAEGLLILKDGKATRCVLYLAKGGGFSQFGAGAAPLFECAEGESLVLTTAASTKAYGCLTYALVS